MPPSVPLLPIIPIQYRHIADSHPFLSHKIPKTIASEDNTVLHENTPIFSVPNDICQIIFHHMQPRPLLLLLMTCRRFHALLQCENFWLQIYLKFASIRIRNTNTYSYCSRPYRELEMRPNVETIRAKGIARRLCARMYLQGCEKCGRGKRVRKVYMPFMIRVCRLCFNDLVIEEKFLPNVLGTSSLTNIFHKHKGLEEAFKNIPRRHTHDVSSLGCFETKTYLRADITRIFPHRTDGELFNFSMQEKHNAVIANQISTIKNNRDRRTRWALAKSFLGVKHSDLDLSPSLKNFVQHGPHTTKKIPRATVGKIQLELWTRMYKQCT